MPSIHTEYPLSEITLRKYEMPEKLNNRDLAKKICLSIGLLQPGDSRDIIVDIFRVIVTSSKVKSLLSAAEIEKLVKKLRQSEGLSTSGTASSNIRRQLKRLKDMLIIESVADQYRLKEFDTLSKIFEERIMKYYTASIVNRIQEYMEIADNDL